MDLEPFVFRHEGRLVGMRAERDGEEPVLAEVNAFALRPLARDEFVAFTLDLCHNELDRHFSRFPEEELGKISEMVPGRPLMERHDLRGSLPRGTFFRSALHQDEGRVSVRPDVYVLRTQDNADFILWTRSTDRRPQHQGGVYRETSIGFAFRTPECSVCGADLRTCDNIPGRTYNEALYHKLMASPGSDSSHWRARTRSYTRALLS